MNLFAEQKQTLKNLWLSKWTGGDGEGWTGALGLAYAHEVYGMTGQQGPAV